MGDSDTLLATIDHLMYQIAQKIRRYREEIYPEDSLHESPAKVLHGKSGILGRVIVSPLFDVCYRPVYFLRN
jgi:hypothetical protein